MMEVGMAIATIKVERRSCRKKSSTNPVKMIPRITLLMVSLTVLSIKRDESSTITSCEPAGSSALMAGISFFTVLAISTGFPSEVLIILIVITLSSFSLSILL